MEIITTYLMKEKQLGVMAGIFGVASLVVGLCLLYLLPRFKFFSMTLIILGIVEAGIFISVYYFKTDKSMQYKLAQYEKQPDQYIAEQTIHAAKALDSFFKLKLIYAGLIVLSAECSSKLQLGNIMNEILYALIIHLALAITIDNFGEQYTRMN